MTTQSTKTDKNIRKHTPKLSAKLSQEHDNSILVDGYGRMSPEHQQKHFKDFPFHVIGKVREQAEQTVTMNIPFLIRILEWAREEAKTDVQVHSVVERMVVKGTLDMSDYEEVTK